MKRFCCQQLSTPLPTSSEPFSPLPDIAKVAWVKSLVNLNPAFLFQEKERLAKFFSHYYDMDMLDRELSVKGWNWGTTSFNGAVMNFQTGTNDAFEIPLGYVNQCNPGKNEVTLEFHPVRIILGFLLSLQWGSKFRTYVFG